MGSNGHFENSRQTMKSYPPGIHAPSVTYFQDNEQQEIDWATQERHLEFLVTSGVHGSMFSSHVIHHLIFCWIGSLFLS